MSRTRAQAKQADKKARRKKQVAARAQRPPAAAHDPSGPDLGSGLAAPFEAVPRVDPAPVFTELWPAMQDYGFTAGDLTDEERRTVEAVEQLGRDLVARGWTPESDHVFGTAMYWTFDADVDPEDCLAVTFSYAEAVSDRVEVAWHSPVLDDVTYHPVAWVRAHLDEIEAHRHGDPVPDWAR